MGATCVTVFTVHRIVKVVSSEVLRLCTVIILYVSVVLISCRRACKPTFLVVSPCRRTCTIVLCISSGTNGLWPHPFIYLFSSYPSLSLTIRIHFPKHTITSAPVHIILRSWSVCLRFASECSHMDTFDIWVHLVILEVVILCVCVL